MIDLKVPIAPIPEDPIAEMSVTMANIDRFPDLENLRYSAKPSSCGLGKTQGTKGEARGIEFDSYWEFAWYIYQTDIKGNIVTRNTTDSFAYTNENGDEALFYPDFKMCGEYHEIKGIYRTNDMLKREATLGAVTFWGPAEIKPIIKMVTKEFPNWKNEYMEMSHKTVYGKTK